MGDADNARPSPASASDSARSRPWAYNKALNDVQKAPCIVWQY